jgi:phage tail-like protein
MNVNGSRFHLLLGREDWGRCFDSDETDALTLDTWWRDAPVSPAFAAKIPEWDAERNELRIRSEQILLPPTPRETPFTLASRRGAAADRHGNIYYISGDRSTLLVWSVGSQRESAFWPEPDTACPSPHDSPREDFQVLEATSAREPARMLALAVTDDHYLVVAFARGPERGFLSFDLAAGGSPQVTLWPSASFEPFDMASRCGGGVWVLDRPGDARRLWELDVRLAVVSLAQSDTMLEEAVLDDFQPVTGPAREQPPRTFPGGMDLTIGPLATIDPIAVEMVGCNQVLLLDRDESAHRTRVLRVRRRGDEIDFQSSAWLPDLAHDFVLAEAYERTPSSGNVRSLFVSTITGNQALAFTLDRDQAQFALHRQVNLFPLRRYFGRALLAVRGRAHYDSGEGAPRWTPIVQQPRARCLDRAELVTPVFDSQEPRMTWDRIIIDACVPPDTYIEIESRAADDVLSAPAQALGAWRREPDPYLRGDGAELPWLRDIASRPTRRSGGVGSWELLLQNARGRYLQLRIRLFSGNGMATPRVRALRAWMPRFSYSDRFLPAVYREDSTVAGFLGRWLANFEGTLTGIEERIAQSQVLLDSRTAPPGALGWLLQWFDVAFDPSWDEPRRRMFVRHAMDFFRWRGTTHGLRLALELAFNDCIDEWMFDGPRPDEQPPQSIRLVEAFMTRLVGKFAAGDPQALEQGPRELAIGERWQPAEGNAGLADRYAKYLGRLEGATPAGQITPFPLVPPADPDDASVWRKFLSTALGFVPMAGAQERVRWRHYLSATQASDTEAAAAAEETLPSDWPKTESRRQKWRSFCELGDAFGVRARWQDFLARRYRRIEQLNRAYQTSWPSFDVVALPDTLPATAAAQADWLQFEGHVLALHRTAHRFSVLLPVKTANEEPSALEERLRLAQRIVELEKPAHTVFDVRLYWALNRLGEARLGIDTLLGQGSRAPELIPYTLLGRSYIGASFVAGPERPAGADRMLLEC